MDPGMNGWGAQQIPSLKTNNKNGQNYTEQQFKNSENWPMPYKKLGNIYQENLLNLSKNSGICGILTWSFHLLPLLLSSMAQGEQSCWKATLIPEGLTLCKAERSLVIVNWGINKSDSDPTGRQSGNIDWDRQLSFTVLLGQAVKIPRKDGQIWLW